MLHDCLPEVLVVLMGVDIHLMKTVSVITVVAGDGGGRHFSGHVWNGDTVTTIDDTVDVGQASLGPHNHRWVAVIGQRQPYLALHSKAAYFSTN